MDNRPIGIFDSGVGGLTVVNEVMKLLPNEDIIYFGDTARVPYGSKSKETVTKFSSQIIRFLISKNVKAIIIACNTVSSNCFSELKNNFNVPIVEVVGPGAYACARATKNNIVGVIGTEATIRSKAYEKKIKDINNNINVYSKSCPLFVPLAEEGWTNNEIARMTAEIYLKELIDTGIDSILLGCTHYPLLKECIKTVIGDYINIINPAEATALNVKDFLENNNMLNGENNCTHIFYVSDNTAKFDLICNIVLNENYNAQMVDIEKY